MLRKVVTYLLLAMPLALSAQPAPPQRERHFIFDYRFTVKNVGMGDRVRIWIPLAHSDDFQDVKVISKSGDLPLKEIRQAEFGNFVLYAESPKSNTAEFIFDIKYEVVRREHVVLAFDMPVTDTPAKSLPPAELSRYLLPDRLVPVTGVPAELAAQVTKDAATPIEKAKDIYDYVFRTMKYDKSGTGWGQGDTLWACDAKHGNCTDFHSVFISMARAEKIPARFEIGFQLPADYHSAEIPGYHCWAEFYLDKTGWVPIDISEAWKHRENRTYFFGAHDVNRMQFTVGRDLHLAPKQDGPPLNFFIYPYVELDGKEYANISIAFSFKDLELQISNWR